MLFADVAQDYWRHIKHERGLSTNTSYCYKRHLIAVRIRIYVFCPNERQ